MPRSKPRASADAAVARSEKAHRVTGPSVRAANGVQGERIKRQSASDRQKQLGASQGHGFAKLVRIDGLGGGEQPFFLKRNVRADHVRQLRHLQIGCDIVADADAGGKSLQTALHAMVVAAQGSDQRGSDKRLDRGIEQLFLQRHQCLQIDADAGDQALTIGGGRFDTDQHGIVTQMLIEATVFGANVPHTTGAAKQAATRSSV
ncbi:MAG: hypothetical protein ABI633_03595, partial [Burkholderiales bacterium]